MEVLTPRIFSLKMSMVTYGALFYLLLYGFFLYRFEYVNNNHPIGNIYTLLLSNYMTFVILVLILYFSISRKFDSTFQKYDKMLKDK